MQEQALRDGAFQSTPSAWRETHAGTGLNAVCLLFQSTPSAWRETSPGAPVGGNRKISIHSIRMEGDETNTDTKTPKTDFNPLPPYGGRLV